MEAMKFCTVLLSGSCVRLVLGALIILGAPLARAFEKPAHGQLANFDARRENAPKTNLPLEERLHAAADLRRRMPEAKADFDEITGSPKHVATPSGYLTGPRGEGGAVTPEVARAVAADDPYRPVKAFLNEHSRLYGHRADVLSTAKLKRESVWRHNGVRTTVWEQQLEGVGVFDAVMIGHTTARGELISLSSQFIADPPQAADAGQPNRRAPQAPPLIPAAAAVVAAANGIERVIALTDVVAQNIMPIGADQRQRFRVDELPGHVDARLVWLPMDAWTLRLCWQVDLTRPEGGERYRVLVEARTSEMLVRRCLTLYLSEASYRVFTGDSPSPLSPGHLTPSTNQPPVVPRALVRLSAFSTNASPVGWIHDGANETRGNNVDAHLDRNADDQPDLPRPHGARFRVFDFPLDLAQPPHTYGEASVVQLFYWCNWAHDRLYELGFTEDSGNFQKDNFDRGGAGNDPILADAQDGSGFNNANFTPTPDGEPGRIQMFLFSGPEPDRDGDFDAEIVIHEYVHGLSTRLVGGGVGISALQTGGMGEGWSDFYALALLSEPGDDPDGVYAMGGYATLSFVGLEENYYFGIRRYPYSTDMTRNPLTFKDIDPSQASPHFGVPASPIIPFSPFTASEVHAQGEVWCVTLWEARANLIRQHGFEQGNRLILQLVTDGMKLAPPNPNFLQARDAIILADQINSGGANYEVLWAAFVKRGMGFNAQAPSAFTTFGVVESYEMPDSLLISPPRGFVASGPAGGPFHADCRVFTLTNYTSAPIEWVAAPTQPWLSVSPSEGTLPAMSATNVSICLRAETAAFGLGNYSASVLFSNRVSHFTQTRPVELRVMAFASMPFLEDFESGAFHPYWNVARTGAARATVTQASLPFRGSYHLTLDGSGVNQPGRNEATLGLDLAGYSNVVLRFVGRNIGDEPDAPPSNPFADGADFDGVAVSSDGTTWVEVQPLRFIPSEDTEFVVDLDEVITAHGLSYTSTFQIRFNQFDDYAVPFDGIAIDEILVTGLASHRLIVHLPAQATEGGGLLAERGRVTLAVAPQAALDISLISSDPSKLRVPVSITFPAGATNATFNLTVLDNTVLGGAEPVKVTAVAPGLFNEPGSILIIDDESARLTLEMPALSQEGFGLLSRAGRIMVNKRPARDIAVSLSVSLPEEVSVPPFVTIPAGQSRVAFDVMIVDDAKLDGGQTAKVTARVEGWRDGKATIYVLDNDVRGLSLTLPTLLSEADGASPGVGTVRLGATLSKDLVVFLASANPAKLRVPRSVVVPAEQISADFEVRPVNNALIEGTKSVSLTASAAGFPSASAAVTILDDEIPAIPYSPDPSHLSTNTSITAEISWAGGVGEIVRNGNFETAKLDEWKQENGGFGSWVINNGEFNPEGPDGPLLPQEGAYNVVSQQIGAGQHLLYQDVFLPVDLRSAGLSWWHRVRNHGLEFSNPNQEFRVEIRDTNNSVQALAFATQRGDPLLGEWEQHTLDLSPWRGQAVRLAFVQQDNLGYLNVHLDAISVTLTSSVRPSFDVYFGTNANPGVAQFLGNTTLPRFALPDLALNTTYYWRVVAKQGAAQSPGPVWTFKTRAVGAFDHFDWSFIPSPQQLDEPFRVTITAQDDINRTVTDFDGAVSLTGVRDHKHTDTILIAEVEPGNNDRVEFVNVAGSEVDISGWEVSFYDSRSWPEPHFTFKIPNGTFSGAGEVFLISMRETAPGDYPLFFTGTNVNWTTLQFNNPIAVLLQDAAGEIVDFACAVNSDPAAIQQPRPIPPGQWTGNPLTGATNLTLSYQRVGQSDGNSASDWIVAPANPLILPEELHLPFQMQAPLSVSPPLISNFVNGVWSGIITVQNLAERMTLKAEAGAEEVGFAAPFTVVAPNDVSLKATTAPNLPLIGDEVTYTFTAANSGPDQSGSVTLRTALSPGLQVLAVTSSQGTCENSNGIVICSLGTLDPAGAATVTVVVQAMEAGTASSRAALLVEGSDRLSENNEVIASHPVNLPLILPPNTSSAFEGNVGTTNLVFRFRLQPACRLPVSVNFTTEDVAAMSGIDYVATNGTVLFAAGSTNAQAEVPVLGDRLDEPVEVFNLRFSSLTNATVLVNSVRGAILDNDPSPTFSLNNVTVTEGPAGTQTNAVFEVRLSAPSALQASVDYETRAASPGDSASKPASAGNDFEPVSGSLLFPPGTTNQTVVVSVLGDRFYEPTETFALGLTNAVNAGLPHSEGIVTILDDDAGALDHFDWSVIHSPQRVHEPFAATITARDAQNNLVRGFTGEVALRGLSRTGEIGIGGGTNGWQFPFATLFHDARTQVIYLADEMGGAGTLSALSLFVLATPGQMLSNWTIRLRHTSLTNFATAAWEDRGWATVYQRHQSIRADGWMTFTFDQSFAYDGSNHLMVDFSYDNAFYTQDGFCAYSETAERRSAFFQTDSAFGDPMDWVGSASPRPIVTNRVPNLRWSFEHPIPIAPARTGKFVDGVWTGEIAVLEVVSNILLRAVAPEGVIGTANPFSVGLEGDINSNHLPDEWELRFFGSLYPSTTGADNDPDADGQSNLEEFLAGTDPLNKSSVFIIARVELRDGKAHLRFTTSLRRIYRVEFTDDLSSSEWRALTESEGTGGVIEVIDSEGAQRRSRFYRVRLEQTDSTF